MKKVLVVDDERQILELTKRILKSKGFEVLSCVDGSCCLERLKEENVDLVLMDYYLSDMNGMEVIEKIREDLGNKNLKIVLFTVVNPSEFSEEELKDLNIIDFIHKPFDIDNFVIRVESVLAK